MPASVKNICDGLYLISCSRSSTFKNVIKVKLGIVDDKADASLILAIHIDKTRVSLGLLSNLLKKQVDLEENLPLIFASKDDE